ncbi:phospholipase D family protein [Pseudomonas sichuanensis]|uniref:phospholipase D family protein n=1 Tax=Pseudomonas sichuanensis TaxID=2213015 RepID=UPI00381737B8
MDLLLLPDSSKATLADVYRRAFRRSTHLYIVSAYLTNWDIEEELGKQCETFTFIVGKDFGITRKAACLQVLSWLPKKWHEEFLVAEGIVGFHPKAMFWREVGGSCYALVGSSNLSNAAFSANHEANGFSLISKKNFSAAEEWIEQVAHNCATLDANWLAGYQEAVQPPKPKHPAQSDEEGDSAGVYDLMLPDPKVLAGLKDVLGRRREQMLQFAATRSQLESAFRSASEKTKWDESDSLRFYDALNSLWSYYKGNRFQGAGWERQGRNSNFQELARSVVRVLDATEISRDRVVRLEIDRLASAGVRTRGALFSEMLCQFFPEDYYVLNSPIRHWLQGTGVSKVRGATQGANYIRSARLLRIALGRAKKYPAKNLAELDAVIWRHRNPDAAI